MVMRGVVPIDRRCRDADQKEQRHDGGKPEARGGKGVVAERLLFWFGLTPLLRPYNVVGTGFPSQISQIRTFLAKRSLNQRFANLPQTGLNRVLKKDFQDTARWKIFRQIASTVVSASIFGPVRKKFLVSWDAMGAVRTFS